MFAESLAGKEVDGRTIVVTSYDPTRRQANIPHVLFVHRNVPEPSGEELQTMIDQHVLVVGESSQFVHRIGIIGFVEEDKSLRFQINIAAAKRSDLKLSAHLARLGEVVKVEL